MNNITIGKVNDIKGFFRTYQELKSDNFNSLFGEVTESDVLTLDYCLSDLYGSRYLQSRFTDIFNNQSANNCMTRIVILADKLYFENWLNTKQTIEKALLTDLDKPLTSEKTGENTTENKVNAFDSETASDSDNSTHNYSETTQYSNGKTATQNAKTQIDFTKNNDFLEIIINDILSMCCLSIYDDDYIPCHSSSGGGGSDPELESRVTQCETDITDIKKLIPATATEQNKLATLADVQSGYDDTELREKIEENTEDIQGIYDDLTDYATKTELQAVENQIPDVSGLATKTELQVVESQIPDVSGLATKTELQAVENQIPDVSGLATKTEVQAISDLIPSNASTQNKLATMADIGGGGGSSIGFVKSSQYPVTYNEILSGLGLSASDLPLVLKIDFAGTYNNNNVYDSCILELVSATAGGNTIHEMAKSSSVKYWGYSNSIAVSGSSNDNVYGNGLYCFTPFKA
ncbi:hypothetical protein II906_05645 [bacterium]|nr:hypothetical protein [bacterium]